MSVALRIMVHAIHRRNGFPRAPLTFIDVVSHDLIEYSVTPGFPVPQYATLSYVWGRIPDVPETTKDNVDRLKTLGALSHGNVV